MGITTADGNAILAANFAPWVLDLGLVVEETRETSATLRLPWSDTLGDVLIGPGCDVIDPVRPTVNRPWRVLE